MVRNGHTTEHFIQSNKHYGNDKTSWFHEASCRFNIPCDDDNCYILLLSIYTTKTLVI